MSPAKAPRFHSAESLTQQFHSQKPPMLHLSSRAAPGALSASRDNAILWPLGPTASAGGKFRPTQPDVKAYGTGSSRGLDEIAADDVAFEKAMAEFQPSKFAASNVASQQARASWWKLRAASRGMEPYPLTVEGINVAGALLKAGGHRSSAQYLAAMKREHLAAGHEWSDALQMAVRDAVRSCTRGMGPDKCCPAIDFRALENIQDLEPVAGGPKNPVEIVVLFALFACREMEAALRQVNHLIVEEGRGCGVVSFYLPATKTDSKGAGVLRRQGCTCHRSIVLCPVRAAKTLLQTASLAGHGSHDPLLVVATPKLAPTKQQMIKTFRHVAEAMGLDETSVAGIAGHVLRCSGAQYMARVGIEFYKIQLFCRWGSETILRYLRDVPLEDSPQWLNQATDKNSLEEIVQTASDLVREYSPKVAVSEIEKVIVSSLETTTAEVLLCANEAKDDIASVVAQLKERQIEVNDQWAAELSRRFLPKFVLNCSTNKVHAVRDAYTTGCGFEFRNTRVTRDFMFLNNVQDGQSRCEAQGCIKQFSE